MLAGSKMAGLVLAGGRSTRMGAEKAVQLLAGRALMDWSLTTLGACCARVAVSAPAGSEAARLASAVGCEVLADHPDHVTGPLAGVAAGLAWASELGFARLATLPCDTPLVPPGVFARLSPLGHAVTPDGPQALCAIWPTQASSGLAARLAAGDHPPVRHLLVEVGAGPVMFEDASPFANANTAADLAALEARLRNPR